MKKVNELPGESRIWIYQAERSLTAAEVTIVENKIRDFMQEWTSHGQKMEAAAELIHQRFLVIAADEQQALASGCGIDKSVHFVKSLGTELGIDFFRRTQIVYRDKDELRESELNLFWAQRKAGIILDSTVVFDNTIKKVSEMENKWEVPFAESWHAEMWLK